MFELEEKNRLFDFSLFIVLTLFSVFFIIVVYRIYDKPLFDGESMDMFNWGKFFSICILLPIIEEFAFRGFFSFSNSVVIIFSLLCLGIVLYTFLGQALIVFTILFIVGMVLLKNEKILLSFNEFIGVNFNILLIITAFLFSIGHIKNYEEVTVFTSLMLFPRFISGVYFGYIAYKYGILQSTILHMLNNLLPFVILFIKYKS